MSKRGIKKTTSQKKELKTPKEFLFGKREKLYFDNLNKKSSTGKMDNFMEQFWLCTYIGLAHNRQADPGEGPQMVDYFPGRTRTNENLLRGFVFYRYAKENGYVIGDREILKAMRRFFDETSDGKLSERGYYEFSRYAAGGFELILDKIGPTYDLATFLVKYVELLKNYPENSK
jgi:hypothetical protein